MIDDENNCSLIPAPDVSLAIARTATGRVLSEMVGEMLALARQEALVTTGEYVNSLGMKFVPVPGTKVLFSVCETRVQDYEVFAKETKREWPAPDFQQGPTHPAVNVTWEDSVMFCEWLSKKEGRTYRLPTDEEWSVAVGLAREIGSTPAEKNCKLEGYPWGNAWPPPQVEGYSKHLSCGDFIWGKAWPPRAGNDDPVLKEDDFENTNPVGSFAANAFGLYDLSGSVFEWCEDYYDGKKEWRVLRGQSWKGAYEGGLRSSFRNEANPTCRWDEVGFRCVLVVSIG
jgi:formylglycine-generating enzyme required for sulfatase activity